MSDDDKIDHIGEVIAEDVSRHRVLIGEHPNSMFAQVVKVADYDELRQQLADVSNELDIAQRHLERMIAAHDASEARNAELCKVLAAVRDDVGIMGKFAIDVLLGKPREHILYRDGDSIGCIPPSILDRNGQVCLAMCTVCGKAESELDGPCEGEAQSATAKLVLSFDFEHPSSKELRTVTMTKRDVFDGMEDYFYDKIAEQVCHCESVGETTVIDCRCDEYVHDFEIVNACLDEVAKLNGGV